MRLKAASILLLLAIRAISPHPVAAADDLPRLPGVEISGIPGPVTSFGCSSTHPLFLAGFRRGEIQLYDAATSTLADELQTEHRVRAAKFSDQGQYWAAMSCSESETVYRIGRVTEKRTLETIFRKAISRKTSAAMIVFDAHDKHVCFINCVGFVVDFDVVELQTGDTVLSRSGVSAARIGQETESLSYAPVVFFGDDGFAYINSTLRRSQIMVATLSSDGAEEKLREPFLIDGLFRDPAFPTFLAAVRQKQGRKGGANFLYYEPGVGKMRSVLPQNVRFNSSYPFAWDFRQRLFLFSRFREIGGTRRHCVVWRLQGGLASGIYDRTSTDLGFSSPTLLYDQQNEVIYLQMPSMHRFEILELNSGTEGAKPIAKIFANPVKNNSVGRLLFRFCGGDERWLVIADRWDGQGEAIDAKEEFVRQELAIYVVPLADLFEPLPRDNGRYVD